MSPTVPPIFDDDDVDIGRGDLADGGLDLVGDVGMTCTVLPR